MAHSGAPSNFIAQNLGQVATSSPVQYVAMSADAVPKEGSGGETENDTEQMDSESQLTEPFQEILALSTEPMKLANPVSPASCFKDAKANQYWFFVV